jgi:glycosyltransferase involved in cell wall biosynthesis
LREGCSFALLEALSLAKPVVAFNTCGINEVIQNRVNGILVEPFDVRQMAEAIVQVYNDKDMAKRLGQAGYERVKNAYSLQTGIRRIESEYLNIVEAI